MNYVVKARHLAPAVTTPIEPDPSLPRVCVIGAGASGLAAAKALHLARVPFDCFEMGPVVGGIWVYDNPNGVSSCYETLEINTSCPRMAYSDFPMPAHYPAYARHDQIAAYFESYVDHFGFRHTITFNTKVEEVTREPDGRWRVRITGPDGERSEIYDAVLVANGHHWDARWPEPAYPGEFDGEQIHAHDYRSGTQLVGRDVVVVGTGNSALDISVEAGRVARSANISVRRGEYVLRKFLFGLPTDQIGLPSWLPWWFTKQRLWLAAKLSGSMERFGMPRPKHHPGESHPVQSEGIRGALASGAVTARPGIARLERDRVVFVDGSEAKADLIVWATGYRVTFPFLSPDLVEAKDNNLPLWKRTVHPDLPGLFFLGLLQPVGAVMPLSEAQATWLAQWFAGEYAPPSLDEVRAAMIRDDATNKKHFYASARHTMEVDFDHYLWDLARERKTGRRRAASPAAPASGALPDSTAAPAAAASFASPRDAGEPSWDDLFAGRSARVARSDRSATTSSEPEMESPAGAPAGSGAESGAESLAAKAAG